MPLLNYKLFLKIAAGKITYNVDSKLHVDLLMYIFLRKLCMLQVYNITKDYVNSKVVSPMLKRADSVKQLSISGANNFGEIAAFRLNNAIDVADKYVDKYLPDISDAPDSTSGK